MEMSYFHKGIFDILLPQILFSHLSVVVYNICPYLRRDLY